MSDQSNALSRVVRWGAVGVLLCVAILLYFRMGLHLEPLTASDRAGTTTVQPAP